MIDLLQRVSVLLLIAFPTTMLTVRGGTGVCFFLLLFIAFVSFTSRKWRDAAAVCGALRMNRWYVAGMCALPVAILLQQAFSWHGALRAYDVPLRLMLGVPVFLYLRTLPVSRLKLMHWGFTFGAIGAALVGWNWTFVDHLGRATNYFLNAVPFGNIAALLGLLSGLTIVWVPRRQHWVIALKVIGFAAGMWAAYLSETRGAWVMAIVLLVAALISIQHLSVRQRVVLVTGIVLLCVLAFFWIGPVHERVMAAMSDMKGYDHGDAASSIGYRMQLWRLSWDMFLQHPLIGVGAGNFNDALQAMVARGEASAALVEFQHAHSELLFRMAELGMLGLVATLLAYVGPAVSLWRGLRAPLRDQRIAARIGVIACASVFLSGLTETMYVLTMSTAFYSLLFAALLAAADAQRATLATSEAKDAR